MNTIRSLAQRFIGLAAVAAAGLLAGCVAPAATTVHYEQAVGGAGVYQETYYHGAPAYYGGPVYQEPYYGRAYPPAVVVPAPVMVQPAPVIVRPAPVIVERPYSRPPAPAHYYGNEYRRQEPPARAQAESRPRPVAKPQAVPPRQAAAPRNGAGVRQDQGGRQGYAPPPAGDTRRDSAENSGP